MNKQSISPTEGVLIIEMPGRGVSLIRSGKSHKKCGHKNGTTQFNHVIKNGIETKTAEKTTWRQGHDWSRELIAERTVSHHICKISEDLAFAWAHNARPEEIETSWKEGKKVKKMKPLYSPDERFALALNDHFLFICESAMIRPIRCSWKFHATDPAA